MVRFLVCFRITSEKCFWQIFLKKNWKQIQTFFKTFFEKLFQYVGSGGDGWWWPASYMVQDWKTKYEMKHNRGSLYKIEKQKNELKHNQGSPWHIMMRLQVPSSFKLWTISCNAPLEHPTGGAPLHLHGVAEKATRLLKGCLNYCSHVSNANAWYAF